MAITMRQGAFAGFLALLCGLGGHAAAEDLLLEQNNFGPDRAFLEPIARQAAEDSFVDWPLESFAYVGRYDLNGDGQYELIVGFETSYHCGLDDDSVSCHTYVYQRVGDGWRLISNMSSESTYLGRRPVLLLFAEDGTHKGWRKLRHKGFIYCWTEKPDPRQLSPGDPPPPGYLSVVEVGRKCPD